MPIPQKMYVDTNKPQYVQGEKVIIYGRLEIADPTGTMQFWIRDDHNVEIWKSKVFTQPYNHYGYQSVEPPIDIFKSKPPYYGAFGISDGHTGKAIFAYY